MTGFLLLLAGSNRQVLARAPGEEVKQAALGGVVLTTAGLATISSTFALYTAVHAPFVVAPFFGLLWGVAIANLDRWLVTATARQPTAWQNIKLAVPRLLFAVIIGVVVSTPLTLQIFKAEIDSELAVMQAEERAAFERQLAEDPRYRDLPELRKEISELEAPLVAGVDESAVYSHPEVQDLRGRLDTVEKQWFDAEQDVVCEREGTCGALEVGAGPAFREKVALRDRLQGERDELKAALEARMAQVRADVVRQHDQAVTNGSERLVELRTRVADIQAARDAEQAQASAATGSSDGLLARLKALHRIGADDEVLGLAHFALFLFFTLLECLPVLFKLVLALGKPSLYERLMMLGDEEVYTEVRRRADEARAEKDVRTQTTLKAHEARLSRQLQAEVDAAQAVLDAQVHLAKHAVAIWHSRQQELVDQDVDAYVTSGAPVEAVSPAWAPSRTTAGWGGDSWSAAPSVTTGAPTWASWDGAQTRRPPVRGRAGDSDGTARSRPLAAARRLTRPWRRGSASAQVPVRL